jgi:hypothetical protein
VEFRVVVEQLTFGKEECRICIIIAVQLKVMLEYSRRIRYFHSMQNGCAKALNDVSYKNSEINEFFFFFLNPLLSTSGCRTPRRTSRTIFTCKSSMVSDHGS